MTITGLLTYRATMLGPHLAPSAQEEAEARLKKKSSDMKGKGIKEKLYFLFTGCIMYDRPARCNINV